MDSERDLKEGWTASNDNDNSGVFRVVKSFTAFCRARLKRDEKGGG